MMKNYKHTLVRSAAAIATLVAAATTVGAPFKWGWVWSLG
jgi:hypothetical protein